MRPSLLARATRRPRPAATGSATHHTLHTPQFCSHGSARRRRRRGGGGGSGTATTHTALAATSRKQQASAGGGTRAGWPAVNEIEKRGAGEQSGGRRSTRRRGQARLPHQSGTQTTRDAHRETGSGTAPPQQAAATVRGAAAAAGGRMHGGHQEGGAATQGAGGPFIRATIGRRGIGVSGGGRWGGAEHGRAGAR